MPHCALHHSAVISLKFRGLFDRDVAGVRAVENLVYVKAARRHGSGKFTPCSLSPPLAGNSRAPVAASEPVQQTRQSVFTLQNSPCIDSGLLSPLLGTA